MPSILKVEVVASTLTQLSRYKKAEITTNKIQQTCTISSSLLVKASDSFCFKELHSWIKVIHSKEEQENKEILITFIAYRLEP